MIMTAPERAAGIGTGRGSVPQIHFTDSMITNAIPAVRTNSWTCPPAWTRRKRNRSIRIPKNATRIGQMINPIQKFPIHFSI